MPQYIHNFTSFMHISSHLLRTSYHSFLNVLETLSGNLQIWDSPQSCEEFEYYGYNIELLSAKITHVLLFLSNTTTEKITFHFLKTFCTFYFIFLTHFQLYHVDLDFFDMPLHQWTDTQFLKTQKQLRSNHKSVKLIIL